MANAKVDIRKRVAEIEARKLKDGPTWHRS
jgi:hypothetical protein